MNFKFTFAGLTALLNKVTKLLIPLVVVSLLLGILLGIDTPFVGDVYKNVSSVVDMLGEDGLLVLISVITVSYTHLTLPTIQPV